MTTVGTQVALNLPDCALPQTLRNCPVAWHLARFLAARFLFAGVRFVSLGLRSQMQV
jgi:hypothetical protein